MLHYVHHLVTNCVCLWIFFSEIISLPSTKTVKLAETRVGSSLWPLWQWLIGYKFILEIMLITPTYRFARSESKWVEMFILSTNSQIFTYLLPQAVYACTYTICSHSSCYHTLGLYFLWPILGDTIRNQVFLHQSAVGNISNLKSPLIF